MQAAGRCNREFNGTTGTVTAWRLASPDSTAQPPSELINGRQSLLRPTRNALRSLRGAGIADSGSFRLAESAVISDGVKQYYDLLHHQRQTATRDDETVSWFDAGDGDRLRQASLINQDYATRDLLVPVTGAEVGHYDRYEELCAEGQWDAAEEVFDDLKSALVTVPVADEGTSAEKDAIVAVDVSTSLGTYQIETGRGVIKDDVSFDLE
ncbi:hypothetical protein [Halorientalis pallida]|uniref:Uncharacterized protein n=1 Tax=Halorientalis pallida TaxID=2479928 RepID=A0A498L270_9EURY|nr:hypothetical protein [Halorientalis pallida]RXK48697.1 hypothetical protein EAF64_13580 [Halorientalis pallida]